MAEEEIIKTCPCGETYTRKRWGELAFVGRQESEDGLMELRNCPKCRSTIVVIVEGAARAGRPLATKDEHLSQQCGLYGDHAHCPRETTLGTGPCECPCHGAKPGRLN
jgi:hypothetical protein